MYNHKCNQCNIDFKSKKKKQNYCSRECYYISKKGMKPCNIREWKNKCTICNKIVKRDFAINRDGTICKHIFCSNKCYLKYHKEKITYRICKYCNKEFKVNSQNKNNLYCSCQCNKDYKKLKATSKNDIIGSTIDRKFYIKRCKQCNKIFETKRADYSMCSQKCITTFYNTNENRKKKISIAFSGKNHPRWVNHPLRGTKRDMPTVQIKEYVYKLFNNKCFKCGSTDSLSIDHNVPNIKGGFLTFTNSVLLCKSCNSSKFSKDPSEFYTKKQLNKLAKMGICEDSLFNFIR